LKAWPSTPGRGTLTRPKEGGGDAQQEDYSDAQRQEKEIGKTRRKQRIKGKQEWKNGRKRKGRIGRGESEERKGRLLLDCFTASAQRSGRGGGTSKVE
jgi:hypothetical protein